MKKARPPLDISEARRRRRERIIIVITMAVIAGLTYLESQLSHQQGVLPASNNILIFGLININIILIILLIFLIVRNVVKLVFERRSGVIGSRLRTKLVAAFVGLSLIPTIILFLVAINFLSYSIDTWFSIRFGDTLNKTEEIAQVYYQQAADNAKYFARQISADITTHRLHERDRMTYLRQLVEQRQRSSRLGMVEVYFENERENVVFQDPEHPGQEPILLSPKLREEVFAGREVSREQAAAGGDMISGVVPVFAALGPHEVIGIVVVSRFIPGTIVEKIKAISRSSEQYRQLTLLKNPIKFSYIVTLFIVTLLIIFSATWFGMFLAKGITVPIQDLAEATNRIAQGDLEHQIEIEADDEIGVLVDSFNQMTRDLRKSNMDLEQRRRYMEAVLRHVSAGVISIDAGGVITTINRAVEKMLGIRAETILHRPYEEVLAGEHLEMVNAYLQEMRSNRDGFLEKQVDLTIGDRALTLLMTTNVIHDDDGRDLGMVVVFEDLTQLQKAERAAAWREVARRMAHEIKNPLTPVQLSAQRLQKKYGDKLGGDREVFFECTKTIIDQVEVLKNLVNEFSRYARIPVTNPAPHNLNEVIADSVVLFQDAHKEIRFTFETEGALPIVNIDPEQIKRVMVNLLDNAVAALREHDGCIAIRTFYDPAAQKAKVEVADNGTGVPPSYKLKIFEPYFSTKGAGSGLGLAIVNSIIADHHGKVSVRDNVPRGTVVAFEIPVPEGVAV